MLDYLISQTLFHCQIWCLRYPQCHYTATCFRLWGAVPVVANDESNLILMCTIWEEAIIWNSSVATSYSADHKLSWNLFLVIIFLIVFKLVVILISVTAPRMVSATCRRSHIAPFPGCTWPGSSGRTWGTAVSCAHFLVWQSRGG